MDVPVLSNVTQKCSIINCWSQTCTEIRFLTSSVPNVLWEVLLCPTVPEVVGFLVMGADAGRDSICVAAGMPLAHAGCGISARSRPLYTAADIEKFRRLSNSSKADDCQLAGWLAVNNPYGSVCDQKHDGLSRLFACSTSLIYGIPNNWVPDINCTATYSQISLRPPFAVRGHKPSSIVF